MEFNKEEISLCKQVAEKHRKPIGYGDWFLDPNVMEKHQARLCTYVGEHKFEEAYRNFTPLWTISDCLEFLRERKLLIDWSIDTEWDENGVLSGSICFYWKPSPKEKDKFTVGKTPLEACLKAVLAVLGDK